MTQWCNWEKRLPGHATLNLGLAGETVEELLDRRDRIRAAIENPDFIFLMIGINNLAQGRNDIFKPYQEFVRNLTTWHKKAHLVVESILPVTWEGISSDMILQTNRILEQIADAYGAKYLDIHSLFLNSRGIPIDEYLQPDGVHVSAEGYTVWSKCVEHCIQAQSR